MKLSQYGYDFSADLLAKYPAENRDESRLMVVNRAKGTIEHRIFKEIIEYFDEKDLFIFNDTKVFPARLYGNKEKTGAEIEIFLLRELNRELRLWDVLVDPARKIRIGNKLYFGDDDLLVAEVIDNTTSRGRTLRFLFDGSYEEFKETLFKLGETPYTAQRFSDYSTINEGNIRTLENGQQVIDLKQQKTGNHVVIPVRPELQAILEKYDNRLPRTYEQKVNHLIKEIAREAGITEKVEVSYIENGEKKSRLVEKCDLVKTHTARRSGATNMYLAGIPTIAIMKVTGHKTEREFMKYIKITEEQTALELMSHPYFSGASNTTR